MDLLFEEGSEIKKIKNIKIKKEGRGREGKGNGEQKKIGQRELEIMRLCFEQRFMTNRQLRRWMIFRYGLNNENSVRTLTLRSIQYLASHGFIEIFKIYHSTDSEAFRVTAKGMAVLLEYGLADSKDVAAISNEADQIRHDLYATDVRLVWEQISPRSQWCSERLLKSTNREQIPDAVLAFYSGELLENISIAIEIELTQKSSSRYHKKFTDYESGPHDFVFYFAGNPTIASAIYEVSKDISDIIFVCEIDDFLKQESLTRFTSHNDHFVLQERIPCVKK